MPTIGTAMDITSSVLQGVNQSMSLQGALATNTSAAAILGNSVAQDPLYSAVDANALLTAGGSAYLKLTGAEDSIAAGKGKSVDFKV